MRYLIMTLVTLIACTGFAESKENEKIINISFNITKCVKSSLGDKCEYDYMMGPNYTLKLDECKIVDGAEECSDSMTRLKTRSGQTFKTTYTLTRRKYPDGTFWYHHVGQVGPEIDPKGTFTVKVHVQSTSESIHDYVSVSSIPVDGGLNENGKPIFFKASMMFGPEIKF